MLISSRCVLVVLAASWLAAAALADSDTAPGATNSAAQSATPTTPAPAPQELVMSVPARVRIEAGWFTMGSDDEDIARGLRTCVQTFPSEGECNPDMFEDERPAHRVHLHAYGVDRTEVSNAEYRRCVNAGSCLPSGLSDTDSRIGLAEHPAVQIRWQEARSYCRWAGGDLPTEAQWEYAARGSSRRVFPWGQFWNDRLANYAPADAREELIDGFRYAAPVDSYPDGKSFFGLRNMAGNVWEYVLDRYGGPYATQQNRVDPEGARTGTDHVIRGGSWRSPAHALRVTFRAHLPENETRPDVGLRCAYALGSKQR
jgi:formylglycine-generating enzyme required for sulfatase activity